MKKRGFTLIELLAVIVILGVLAVIITPIITGFLSKSEEDAYNKQVDNIVKAAKLWGLDNVDSLYSPYLCIAKTTVTSGNLATGEYKYGDEYSCELGDNDEKTFYVLETNEDTVSLIMNMNIDENGKGTTSGSTVSWCSDEHLCKTDGTWDNTKGPITANNYLISATKGWIKLNRNQISLPTYNQIYTAAGNSSSSLSTWLYENLNVNNSVPKYYWTFTGYENPAELVNTVAYAGLIIGRDTGNNKEVGVRPVITIPKSQLGSDSTKSSNSFYLSLETLVNDGIIENDEIINPKTNEKMDGCISITYSEEYKQYEYKYIDNNNLCN